ncbi:MAG: regulatory protein RecX [Saprospiraceae bacterium]|nr:regulatory protein RecX [Saprospiraceae bacterium]
MAFRKTKTGQSPTPDEALLQLERWCAFRERSPLEVKKKIAELGQTGEDAEQLMSVLETDGFFNEERYAESFAGGKFRINRWGKTRIRQALLHQQIQPALIEQALNAIPETEYRTTIDNLVRQKAAALALDAPENKAKIAGYLIRKGFEAELIFSAFDRFQKPDF